MNLDGVPASLTLTRSFDSCMNHEPVRDWSEFPFPISDLLCNEFLCHCNTPKIKFNS